MNCDIDLVIPIVFPQDPEWLRAYSIRSGKDAEGDVRFRSWGTEKLLLQCVCRNMPWLRRIFILLAGESQARYLQDCLPAGPEIVFVYHREFIPRHLLPTFNVCTIEMFLHRIPGLSEHFIYSNDDFFPLSPLNPSDFFRDGYPCQKMNESPYPDKPKIFHEFVMNGLNMVAADFGKHYTKTWLLNGHSMQPMLRSTVEKVCTRHADRIARSFTFDRSVANFNQYIFPFYQHFTGKYVAHIPRRAYVGRKVPIERLVEYIRRKDAGIVCINDHGDLKDWVLRAETVRREIGNKLKNEGQKVRE